MDVMRRCGEWMMSLGWVGMVMGVVLLAALVVLVVLLIQRAGTGPRPPSE